MFINMCIYIYIYIYTYSNIYFETTYVKIMRQGGDHLKKVILIGTDGTILWGINCFLSLHQLPGLDTLTVGAIPYLYCLSPMCVLVKRVQPHNPMCG